MRICWKGRSAMRSTAARARATSPSPARVPSLARKWAAPCWPRLSAGSNARARFDETESRRQGLPEPQAPFPSPLVGEGARVCRSDKPYHRNSIRSETALGQRIEAKRNVETHSEHCYLGPGRGAVLRRDRGGPSRGRTL